MNRILALIIVFLFQVGCSSTQAQNQNLNLNNEVDNLPQQVSINSKQYGHSVDAELALKKAETLNAQALEYLGMARPRYDLVIELSDKVSALTKDEKALATASVNKGKAYEFSGRLDQALIWYKHAFELSHTPEVKLLISRVDDLISTRKNANTPKILNDISNILQRNPLSTVSVKGKKEECSALYSKLASSDTSLLVVAPFATNLPMTSPKLKEYELCRNKPHQDNQFAFRSLFDLGSRDFGIYRIESNDHTGEPREYVYGALDPHELSLNLSPLMAKVDLAACQLQSAAHIGNQLSPNNFGDWLPIVAINEMIKSDDGYYWINLKNVSYDRYLRLTYYLEVFKLNENFEYLCGAIEKLEI